VGCAALSACSRSNFLNVPAGFKEFAYVANSASNTVTVLDLVYLRVDRTLRVGEHPVAIALNPKKAEAYVLNRPEGGDGSVSVIDTEKNAVVATIPAGRGAAGIAVDPTGNAAYVANAGSNTVSVLDLTARRVLSTVHSEHPTGVVVAPDGRTVVVVSDLAATVSLWSATAAVPTGTMPVGPLRYRNGVSGCAGATSAVVLPDSSKAFVACPGTNQVLALGLAVAPGSWQAKYDSALLSDHTLALLDVGIAPTYLTMKPDGGEIFVSNAGSGAISEISTQTNEVGSTFGVGNKPAQGVVSSDNSLLWVTDSGSDSLLLYAIDDGKRLPSIRVGSEPDGVAFSTDAAQRMVLVADKRSGDVAVIRTAAQDGPALLTMLPAGASPGAMVVRSNRAGK